MVIELSKLENYLQDLLEPSKFKDYCANGLIVEGKPLLSKGIVGVSLTLELIERAVDMNADFIIVHHPHGFWEKQLNVIRGPIKKKLELLLQNQITVFGFHLPLDAHIEVGNNAEIARILGMNISGTFVSKYGADIGIIAEYPSTMAYDTFLANIISCIGVPNHVFNYGVSEIKKVAICSGGAPNEVVEVIGKVDLYLTGEAREQTASMAKEEGINFIAAGHHATEVFGVQALANRLKKDLKLDIEFINLPNPI